MAEYIEREALLDYFDLCNKQNPRWTPQRVKTLLVRESAADVAPVVRCCNCINCIDCDGVPYCTHWERNTDSDGYCYEGR